MFSLCSLVFYSKWLFMYHPPHSRKYKLSYKIEESSYPNCRMEFYISIFNYVN